MLLIMAFIMSKLFDLIFHVYFSASSPTPLDRRLASFSLTQCAKSVSIFYLLLSLRALKNYTFYSKWAIMFPQSIALGLPCAAYYLDDILTAHLFFKVVPKQIYFDERDPLSGLPLRDKDTLDMLSVGIALR